MSDNGQDPMRTYLGSAARELPVKVAGPVGPWHARLSITPIVMRRGARFEVTAQWFGPDTEGRWPGGEATMAGDTCFCDSLEDARVIVGQAEEKLASGKVPNLPELSRLRRTGA